MYMDYSKLWKLLIDKGMSKSDLMALTGISSRVIAKLTKNETVTTDTLARICGALDCRLDDIVECVSEKMLSVYSAYKKLGVRGEDGENYQTTRFALGDRRYVVYRTRETANKETRIECGRDGTIYWKQFYPVGYLQLPPVVECILKPKRDGEETVIAVIKGRPSVIAGLDENGFVSSRGVRKSKSDVYVMSEAAFKVFVPQNDIC